ncbi:MAG: hypothetical protein HUK08_00230 [Bacteroidaceae bacterium]|nr:hypothetical protein [Bacteroidaceae bacterium]
MEILTLTQSEVVFEQLGHTYTLHGKQLQGVTGIVSWFFPKTYNNIPEAVLHRAAERGSAIHAAIEMYESFDINMGEFSELDDYKELKAVHKFDVAFTEHLVSDNENIASSIDIVMRDAEICDVKTTSSLHLDNVRLQLSIYAYLLELNNEHIKVPRLSVIWLPKRIYGNAAYKTVERIPSEVCADIIREYLNGGSPDKFYHLFPDFTPEDKDGQGKDDNLIDDDTLETVTETLREYKRIKAQYDAVQKDVRDIMTANSRNAYECDFFKVSLSKDTEVVSFDEARFKGENPELWAKYTKTSVRKGGCRITLK